ncbi:MAG: hypothetical protein R2784_10025 [Saprospiraceae bacterium]
MNLADRVVVTTPKMVELYHAAFEIETGKISVIPPMNALEFPSAVKSEKSFGANLNLGYFGSFFKNIREPDVLFHFLEMLQNQERELFRKANIHFYGDGYEKFKIAEKISNLDLPVQIHAKVARPKVLDSINGMDILLHLGNKSDFQIPSKIAEYICSGIPFIHISQTENDPVINLVKSLNWCKVLEWKGAETDLNGIAEFIVEPPKADTGLLAALRMKFGPERLSVAYLELLLAIK